jgi:hypothetical protein
MIHVATVHARSERWIEPQRRHLVRYLGSPFRAYAFLDDVPGDHSDAFFYASTEPVEGHAAKLDLLADVIAAGAEPTDVLVFIAGDAFPVAPLAPLFEDGLDRHRLIAAGQDENNGDLQPDPSFCVTTVGFWRELASDWHGGNLLDALMRRGVEWLPLRRVNRTNPHPVFFAVYGDDEHGALVYHHGAGSPAYLCRADLTSGAIAAAQTRPLARLLKRVPQRGPLRALHRRYDPLQRAKLLRQEEMKARSDRISSRIERDEEFWRDLVDVTMPIHVLHIGKTAGTALKHALLDHRSVSGYELLLHGHEVTLAHVPVGERFMFVIRDPISRFVSAFNGRLREDRPRYHYPWNDAERAAFSVFKTPDELGAALSARDRRRRRQARDAMRGIGHVNSSYTYWLGDEQAFRSRLPDLFFIAFQERLDADFELLRRKLGLPPDVQLPTGDEEAHRTPQTYDAELGPVARANLERWYARDLAFVALCRELAPAVNEPRAAPATHMRRGG